MRRLLMLAVIAAVAGVFASAALAQGGPVKTQIYGPFPGPFHFCVNCR